MDASIDAATAPSTDVPPPPGLETLARGLSERRLEGLLELPAGAWRSRRLYALRVSDPGYEQLGVKAGDLVVVEPGAREREGQLVVARAGGRLALSRIQARRETDSGETLWLPLRVGAPRKTRTVGTVIAVARPTASGGLRVLGRRRRRGDQAALVRRPAQPSPETPCDPRAEAERLRGRLSAWRAWVARHATDLPPDSKLLEGWRRLEDSLATLVDCLEVAHGDRLAAALVREADRLLRTMRGEAARLRMSDVNRLCA